MYFIQFADGKSTHAVPLRSNEAIFSDDFLHGSLPWLAWLANIYDSHGSLLWLTWLAWLAGSHCILTHGGEQTQSSTANHNGRLDTFAAHLLSFEKLRYHLLLLFQKTFVRVRIHFFLSLIYRRSVHNDLEAHVLKMKADKLTFILWTVLVAFQFGRLTLSKQPRSSIFGVWSFCVAEGLL